MLWLLLAGTWAHYDDEYLAGSGRSASDLPASVRWVMWSWTMWKNVHMGKRMQGLCHADEFNKGNWLLRGFSRRGICFTVAWHGHCGIVGLLRADGIFEANNYGMQRQSNYASILTCFTRSFWVNDLFYYSILVKLHFWCYIYNTLYTDRDSWFWEPFISAFLMFLHECNCDELMIQSKNIVVFTPVLVLWLHARIAWLTISISVGMQ